MKKTKWEKQFEKAQKDLKLRDPVGTHPATPLIFIAALVGMAAGVFK